MLEMKLEWTASGVTEERVDIATIQTLEEETKEGKPYLQK